ncbi:MAG: histidine kinase, partial [Belnapia sp.]|nr:histidine kinase [Belnapia sp.]
IDDRRRFTETVLSGVSAGVVGLETDGRINLPNRRASALLGIDHDAAIGQKLADVVPEFAVLLEPGALSAADTLVDGGLGEAKLGEARLGEASLGERGRTAEIRIGPPSNRRTLLAQIGEERHGQGRLGTERDGQEKGGTGGHGEIAGFVLTFDDITELLSAQRKAAWADVARRIAHEIKNPLTPIQLSAERLKRRYLKQITNDPETFVACTDTIVRQVGDIGRMVDEFSAFARMPQPVIRPEDLAQVLREALVLQRDAHPGIVYAVELPGGEGSRGPVVPCDRRLLGQALTNLLMNAADAVAMRAAEEAGGEAAGEATAESPAREGGPAAVLGHITVRLEPGEDAVAIAIEDDGIGLPQGDERERLAEPYVTHKPKGTGLGLAIVKKIMEDHGGRLGLEDRPRAAPSGRGGARAVLILPWRPGADRALDRPSGTERAGTETESNDHSPDGSMRRAHGA